MSYFNGENYLHPSLRALSYNAPVIQTSRSCVLLYTDCSKMKYHTDDLRIVGQHELTSPQELLTEILISDQGSELVFSTRAGISKILHMQDPRLIVVVGPCSIHDTTAALEYASRLAAQAKLYQDSLLIVMRVYFEKPRTTVGWKGLINDPDLDDSFDIHKGLRIARKLLVDIVDMKLPAGTEFLDPITPQYIGDLISWGAIGARTTESQIHRQLGSGLSCPIGFKNNTDGSVQAAVDATQAASHSHIFFGVTKEGATAIFSTSGNEDAHVILRGGRTGTNYDADSVSAAKDLLDTAGQSTGLIIDASHANSEKNHHKQIDVCNNICDQLASGEPRIVGLMLESHLVEGRQDLKPGQKLTFGQSITDACISWGDTEICLAKLADAVQHRNKR